jgi:hypothetical protein
LQAEPVAATQQGCVPIHLEARSSSGTQCAPACTLVIFGAGGDLAKRLLMPSLYNLAASDLLDVHFQVIGVDHADNNDQGRWASLTDTMQSFTKDPAAEFHAPKIDDPARGQYAAGSDALASADEFLARGGGHWLAVDAT